MAKNTFASGTYKSKTFASGHWAGIGTASAVFATPAEGIHFRHAPLTAAGERTEVRSAAHSRMAADLSATDERVGVKRRSTSASPTE